MKITPILLACCILAACTTIPKGDDPSLAAGSGAASSSIVIIPKNNSGKVVPTAAVTIDWIAPGNGETNIKNVGGKVQIKVRIISPTPINVDQIEILINGQVAGGKAEEVALLKRIDFKDQILTAQVPVEGNKSNIQIVVSLAGDKKFVAERTLIKDSQGISVQNTSFTERTRAVWTQPDVFALPPNTAYNARTPEVEIKFNITSPDAIDKSNIKILLNKVYRAPSPTAVLLGSNGNYSFKDVITLNDNMPINEVALRVETSGGMSESQKLKINYSPDRPNLYVLSIGTKTNLKYTTKDARDFANIYFAQGKDAYRMFTNVTIDTLIGKAATAVEIRGAIEAISSKVRTGTILEDDVVIVFISTHGFIDNGELRLQGDDFTSSRLKTTSVHYNNEIMAELDQLPCKKLVFLDACHSGPDSGAKSARPEDINKASMDLKKMRKGLAVFASSSKSEESYEDGLWQNGAFTEVLSKALSDGAADANGNGIITLSELEKYVAAEVPVLVKKVKNKDQHPALIRNDMGDAPIFIVRKKN